MCVLPVTVKQSDGVAVSYGDGTTVTSGVAREGHDCLLAKSDSAAEIASGKGSPPAKNSSIIAGSDVGNNTCGVSAASDVEESIVNGKTSPLSPVPLEQRRTLHPRRVRSAVIVAAGLSTRMFPASAVVKKELFPIVDHDGVCKPVILAIMEGLVESGIERFVVVVQEKDIPVFDDFFSMKAVENHHHR